MATQKITPCLWFENQAEEAARFYTTVFKNSKIESISRYSKEGFEIHGMKEGTVLTVGFEINGQPFTALNGGPLFNFNEAISFQVFCETQEEIDYYWNKLTDGGEESQCGWLKRQVRTFMANHSVHPSKINERPGKIRKSYQSIFANEKVQH